MTVLCLAVLSPAEHRQVDSTFLYLLAILELWITGGDTCLVDSSAQGGLARLPELPPGRKHLPWKQNASNEFWWLQPALRVRDRPPAGIDNACVKVVTRCLYPEPGTSATAKIQLVSSSFVDGKPRNANSVGARIRKSVTNMPRTSVNAECRSQTVLATQKARPGSARGHAAKKKAGAYAIDRAVGVDLAPVNTFRLPIVVLNAAKPCNACLIASGNTGFAIRLTDKAISRRRDDNAVPSSVPSMPAPVCLPCVERADTS